MKKNYIIGLLCCFISFLTVSAQDPAGSISKATKVGFEKCGTDRYMNELLQDEGFAREFYKRQDEAKKKISKYKAMPCTNPLIIPVAIHYGAPITAANQQCLIDAAQAQIDQMNLDYSSCNANAADLCNFAEACPDYFDVPIDQLIPEDGACIQFCLGDQNLPDGEDNIGGFAITVGDYTWPNVPGTTWDGWLNIFVSDSNTAGLGGGILGVAPLGGASNPNGNGVFVLNSAFGSQTFGGCTSGGPLDTGAPYDGGATCTHEVGHYFGLEHTFGPDTYPDTPTQTDPNFGCPTYDTGSCTSSVGTDFSNNFMDYVDDDCMSNFSADQVAAMQATSAPQGAWANDGVSCSVNYQSCQGPCGLVVVCPTAVTTPLALMEDACLIAGDYVLPTDLSAVVFDGDGVLVWSTGGYLSAGGTAYAGTTYTPTAPASCAPEDQILYLNVTCVDDPALQLDAGTITLTVYPDPMSFVVTDLVTFTDGDCNGPTWVVTPGCEAYVNVAQNGGPAFPVTTGSGDVDYNVTLNYPTACCEVPGGEIILEGSIAGVTMDATNADQACSDGVDPAIWQFSFTIPTAQNATVFSTAGLGSIKEVCIDITFNGTGDAVILSLDSPDCGAYEWENMWLGTAFNGGTNTGSTTVCFAAGTPNGDFDGTFDGDDGTSGSFTGCQINGNMWDLWIADYNCYTGVDLPTGGILTGATIKFCDGFEAPVAGACDFTAVANYDCTSTGVGYCDNICYAEYNASPGPDDFVDATLCVTALGCADSPDASCLTTTPCVGTCETGDEVTVTLTGEVCTACGADTTPGCTDATACNYDAAACVDDGSCLPIPVCNTDICVGDTEIVDPNDACACIVDEVQVLGCTDPAACNYDATSNCDDGSCLPAPVCNTDICAGDTEIVDPNDACACIVDEVQVLGCTDPAACNYDATANCDDGSCLPAPVCNTDICAGDTEVVDPADACACIVDEIQVLGCTNATAPNYDPAANCDDGSCICTPDGCIDPLACNYDPAATCDDGSCDLPDGCTDPLACNYDPLATCDDGTCDLGDLNCPDPCNVVLGCTDATACNYDAAATCDDGTCDFGDQTCPDPCNVILGCTDPIADNYDPAATCDDSSCIINCADGSIAGTVTVDDDCDGTGGDVPTTPLTVELYDAAGALVGSVTTDASGNYLFDPVPCGTYDVLVVETDLPPCAQGANPNPRTGITVGDGEAVVAEDFDFQPINLACPDLEYQASASPICSSDTVRITKTGTCDFTGTGSPLDSGPGTGTYPAFSVNITSNPVPDPADFSDLTIGGFIANNSQSLFAINDPCGEFLDLPVNTTCDPLYYHVTVFVVDTDDPATPPGELGLMLDGCASETFTIEIFPQPSAPALDIVGTCQYVLTNTCPDDIITITGGNGTGTSGSTATYDILPHSPAPNDTLSIDVENGNCLSEFFFIPTEPTGPILTCPDTLLCGASGTLSADLAPFSIDFGTLQFDFILDAFPGENFVDVIGASGAVVATFGPLAGAEGSTVTVTVDVPLSECPVSVNFIDTFGDGMQDSCFGDTDGMDGSFTVTDLASGAVLLGQTFPVGDGACGAATPTIESYVLTGCATYAYTVLATGVWSGTGVTDNGDGTATFSQPDDGTYTATYTYTSDIGCEFVETCDVVVFNDFTNVGCVCVARACESNSLYVVDPAADCTADLPAILNAPSDWYYEWYLDGVLVDTVVGQPYYSPSETGNYTVIAYDPTNCESWDTACNTGLVVNEIIDCTDCND